MASAIPLSPKPNLYLPHFKPKSSSNPCNINATHVAEKQEFQKDHHKLYKSYFANVSSLSRNGQIQETLSLLSHLERNNVKIGPEFYVELLQGCVYERSLFLGQQIHGLIIKRGDFYTRNEYIGTKLVILYAKCDALESANLLFSRLCIKNVYSWAAIIGMNSRVGFDEHALMGYCEMIENGIFPDNFVVPNALKACGAAQCVEFGRGIHGYVLKLGFEGCMYVASSLVDMYGKCGVLEDAEKMFDKMPERNVVAWNSMLVGYVQNGMHEEAIQMFYDMRVEGVEPTRVTISSLLSASANLGVVDEGLQGHALAVLYGIELGIILGSSMINFYSKLGWIDDAELVFSKMVEKDVVTWNLLISCYIQHGLVEKAVYMCHQMRLEGLTFDCVTLASLFSSCADSRDIKLGKEGHCYCIRNRLNTDVVVASSMVDMYAKCEELDYARRVFDLTLEKDLVLWNTTIAAYAEHGMSGEALKLIYQMQVQGFHPNVVSWNSVLLGFLRNGLVNEAKDLFSQMQSLGIEPDVVTWNTLLTGLAQNGLGFEAIMLFEKMQKAGIQPSIVSLSSLLTVCTDMTSLQLGKAIHGHVIRHCCCFAIGIVTSLVDMYAKCGNIDLAKKLFDITSDKKLALYNSMISAYGLHSQALEALSLYKHMQEVGIEPDDVTFTSMMSACSHEGLVDQGLDVFADMIFLYDRKPKMEHNSCLFTLLSRCGNLDEAIRVIFTMSSYPDAQLLGSILSACREQNQIQLAEYISEYLLQLEPDNSANYVALCNVYAAAGKWVKASEMRKLMKRQGLEKNPGCSWVEIGTEYHIFVAGDRSHPQKAEICLMLDLLEKEMRLKHLGCNLEIHFSQEKG